MAEWHHLLDGHKFEQALGIGDNREAWSAAVHGVAKSDWIELRQHIKKQRHYFANKGPSIQSYVFFSSHVWM